MNPTVLWVLWSALQWYQKVILSYENRVVNHTVKRSAQECQEFQLIQHAINFFQSRWRWPECTLTRELKARKSLYT